MSYSKIKYLTMDHRDLISVQAGLQILKFLIEDMPKRGINPKSKEGVQIIEDALAQMSDETQEEFLRLLIECQED